MRPTVCLNMIVRDEAGVVTETLDSVAPFIDYWVIVDTGSTDDTTALIEAYFLRKGIPGELHERAWHNFGANRTEALELAADKADYILVMDADDLLVGDIDLNALGADVYQLLIGKGFTWWRRQLFRSGLPWRYEGVVHEYATCEVEVSEERLEGDYHVEPRHLGSRSADPQKYARDAELLLAEHERNPEDPRTVFYLGQSYFSAGDVDQALRWYERRAGMGGFAEEVYYSLLRRAMCLASLERPAAEAFLTAWQSRPTRAEALCELATLYRLDGKYDLAYLFARRASEIPFPGEDVLFVDEGVHAWRSRDERAISAYYIGRFRESYDLCTELLAGDDLPEGERERVRQNREFAEGRLPADRIRVKLIGSFADSQEICARWDRQSEGGGRWGEIEVVPDGEADYIALVNYPRTSDEVVDPARTIVFQMEPRGIVSQWGDWAAPDPNAFVQVRSHDRFPNNGEWYLGLTCDELKARAIEKTRSFSTVTSNLETLPGQRLRSDFIKYLEDAGAEIDVFGWGRRPLVPHKDDGLLPYRYTFAAENSSERNYFTEKIVDAILAECLCFYWGCPNLEDYLPAESFVRLPLDDFERSRALIERTIADGEWERRLPAIREAKRIILDDLQFFPTLARTVRGHRFAQSLEVRVINLDRRPDRWDAFRRRTARTSGERFLERCVRVSAVDGAALAATPELEHLFRGNTFDSRRAIIGCALSHIGVWHEAAGGSAPGFLVLEDDARFANGFGGTLVEVCGRLLEQEDFGVAILGHEHWGTDRELARHDPSIAPRIEDVDWSDYLGGSSGYVVSRAGAQRLVELIERDGIQDPIDMFYARKRDEVRVVRSTPHVVFAPVAFSYGSGVASDIQHDFEPLGSAASTATSGALGWLAPPSPVTKWRGEVSLKTFTPSLEVGELHLNVRPAWPVSNPTIAEDGDGFRVITRSSRDGETLNYVLELDGGLQVTDARPLDGAAGFDDCRLVRVGSQWLVCAHEALLAIEDARVVEVRPLPAEASGAPFVVDGRLHFLVDCAPTRVVAYDVDSGAIEEVSSHPAPERAAALAAHSQGIAVDDGFLFVGQEDIEGDGIVRHSNRFVLLDRDFRLAAASPRFRLTGEGRELCLGLARRDGLFVLSFGVDQEVAALATVDAHEALDLLGDL